MSTDIIEMCQVYTLRYPVTFEVFYVGMAADAYKRFVQHLLMDGNNKEKNEIVSGLKRDGIVPIMEMEYTIRGKYAKDIAERLEAFCIEYYRAAGHKLVNKALTLSEYASLGREIYEAERLTLELFHPDIVIRLYPRWFIKVVWWTICHFMPWHKKGKKHYQGLMQSLEWYPTVKQFHGRKISYLPHYSFLTKGLEKGA